MMLCLPVYPQVDTIHNSIPNPDTSNLQPDTALHNIIAADSALAVKTTNDSLNYGQKDIADVLDADFFHLFFGKTDTVAKKKNKFYKAILPGIGYSLTTKFVATVAAVASFYTDNPNSVNLSEIKLAGNYTQRGQIIVPFQTYIWTKKNNYNIPGEMAYYKYPQFTYGLGGKTSLQNFTKLQYNYLRIRYPILRKVVTYFYLGGGYALDYRWEIKELIPPSGIDDLKLYGFKQRSSSSGVTANMLYDNRRNFINPERGFYANIVYRPNFVKMGSDENWQSLLVDVRKYFKLKKNSNNVLALWSYNWLILTGNPPYLDLPATSWDAYNNQGRGFIQDRFKDKKLIAFEAEYRFTLSRNGLFGAVVFANAQSVSGWASNNFNDIWPAAGIGLRIKLNKHTNTNLAIDFAVGKGGSQGFFGNMGEIF